MSQTKYDKLVALATEALEVIAASGHPVAKGSRILGWIR